MMILDQCQLERNKHMGNWKSGKRTLLYFMGGKKCAWAPHSISSSESCILSELCHRISKFHKLFHQNIIIPHCLYLLPFWHTLPPWLVQHWIRPQPPPLFFFLRYKTKKGTIQDQKYHKWGRLCRTIRKKFIHIIKRHRECAQREFKHSCINRQQ